MFLGFVTLLLASLQFGTLSAQEPSVDINRIRLVPEESSRGSLNSHARRALSENYQVRTNDYDDHSSGHSESSFRGHLLPTQVSNTEKTPIKLHQSREDPRLFYQSDAYLKRKSGNVNPEVSFIYPGRNVVRTNDEYQKSMALWDTKSIHNNGHHFCVKCPSDRTLVARNGFDRVLLQTPRLSMCSGHKAPRNIHLKHLYGPKFGSLIGQGSHTIISRIIMKNKLIQTCKMKINVVVQGCVPPKHLVPLNCDGNNCTLKCRDHRMELLGQPSLICGDDLKWSGEFPVCRARTWCEPPPSPEHGRVSCKGATVGDRPGLAEGTRCRLRCAAGWKWHPRAVAVCRRGSWTNSLTCKSKQIM